MLTLIVVGRTPQRSQTVDSLSTLSIVKRFCKKPSNVREANVATTIIKIGAPEETESDAVVSTIA